MIAHLVSHRLRRGFAALLGGGLVLGLTLGLALASFAAARDTASAYGRVLEGADAETATVAHNMEPDEAAAILDEQPAIARHRYQGGYVAFVEGVDPALTGGVLAPAGDEFPLELPTLEAGRLPDPDRADEVFINTVLADAAHLQVGQDLTMRLELPGSDDAVVRSVTVTGIGIFPREAVADETALTGIVVGTRAFHEENEHYQVYSNSRVWLDDPRDFPDLARALSAEGMFVSETRAQERRGVEEALGPTVTVLVALGVLASLATIVLAVQVAQRRQDRWRPRLPLGHPPGIGRRGGGDRLRDRGRPDAGRVAVGSDRAASRSRPCAGSAPRPDRCAARCPRAHGVPGPRDHRAELRAAGFDPRRRAAQPGDDRRPAPLVAGGPVPRGA